MSKVAEIVTEKILAQLEAGTVPWRKPWTSATAPRNAFSGRAYRGINVFLLLSEGYSSPYWMTFKQLSEAGGTILPREDEPEKKQHGSMIVFWSMVDRKEKVDGVEKKRKRPLLRYFRVWNLEQVEGVKLPKKVQEEQLARSDWRAETEAEEIAAAETIIARYEDGPTVEHDGGDQAYYVPRTDEIHLPLPSDFESMGGYYATYFHELGHSTGSERRLNRFKDVAPTGHGYGREELVAEMTAAMLLAEAGILDAVEEASSASYIASWMRTIREDTNAVVVAAGAAQRAVDRILGTTFEDTHAAAETATAGS